MNLGHWQFLTGFFRLAFVKLFISWFAIVPVAVALLRSIPEVIVVDSGMQPIAIHTELPFSWIVLRIASLLFSVAAVLFHGFCPSFIKRHESFEQYKRIGHSPRWIAWELYYHLKEWGILKRYKNSESLRRSLVAKALALPSDENPCDLPDNLPACVTKGSSETVLYFKHGSRLYRLSAKQSPSQDDQTENDQFWELFGFLADSYPFVRRLIMYLLIASMSLVAIVIAQNIWFALTYIIAP